MSTGTLLEVDHLSVAIGRTGILKDLSFEVRTGEILGLVGASGSGKSMTALAIARLLPKTAVMTGSVRFRDRSLSEASDSEMQQIRGSGMGMVFQEPMTALNPLMRIGDQVSEALRVHGLKSTTDALDAARTTLDLVGLTGEQGALDRLPHQLSGGQRQRVAIAMAIVMAPTLLIADEPTTALDVINQEHVLLLLQELVRSRNMGLILVTHDLAVVAKLADRVAVMHDGSIIEQGETPEVIRHAHHPYTRALLAAANWRPKRGFITAGSSPVLQAVDIVREYPRKRTSLWRAAAPLRAVDGVSLSVNAGETVGLVGESGSGKTSLLKVILALEQAKSGQVSLMGEDFSNSTRAQGRKLRRSLQAVFQDPFSSFDPRWPVERLIGEPFFLLDSFPTAAERRTRICAMLEQVGLNAGDAKRFPQEFSGGERQRIAIARALIIEPAVVAFDEAVSALDVLIRGQVLDLLVELAARLRVAYLFVSHDLHVIRAIADRVYVMQRGRIVEEGFTEAVFCAPRHAYTQSLIAATPTLSPISR
jgi:peptide/nickel transport system ATP-binding protein